MNLQHSPRASALSASLPALNAESCRPGVSGSQAFAGLLGEQMQSRAAEGRRPGERSAFDVPAARAEAPRPARQADRPPSRSAESNQTQEPVARRDPPNERQAAAPASSGAAVEERLRAARKAASSSASRTDDPKPPADREVAQSASDAAAQTPEEDQAADPAEQRRTQAVIDWFSRIDPVQAGPRDPATALPCGAATAASAMGPPSSADSMARAAAGELVALGETEGAGTAGSAAAAGSPNKHRDSVTHPAAASHTAEKATAAAALAEPQTVAVSGMSLLSAEGVDPGSAAATPSASAAAELTAPATPAHAPTSISASPLLGSSATPASAPAPHLLLATPVTSPDFSQALAAQLTTLARDGIQQATLQLHPTEMGPIEVKIVLDGSQAQVDFSAAHALTRQAIESGLPSLAAALHGAGLTLSGGGVFEQRPGTSGGRASSPDGVVRGAAGGADGELDGSPLSASRHQVVRGLVDIYA